MAKFLVICTQGIPNYCNFSMCLHMCVYTYMYVYMHVCTVSGFLKYRWVILSIISAYSFLIFRLTIYLKALSILVLLNIVFHSLNKPPFIYSFSYWLLLIISYCKQSCIGMFLYIYLPVCQYFCRKTLGEELLCQRLCMCDILLEAVELLSQDYTFKHPPKVFRAHSRIHLVKKNSVSF